MHLRFDRITGKPSIIKGEGIPWIPSWANTIKGSDLGLPDGIEGKDVPLKIVEQKAIELLAKYPELFLIYKNFLKINFSPLNPIKDANSSLFNAIILSVEVQRAKGKPEWQSYNFEVLQEGDYFINLTNGDYFNKETACSSAEVNIDGIGQIFGPNDFNKNVFALKKQLHLAPGNYNLNAILRSQLGCYTTIVVSNKDIFSFEELP